MCQRSVFNLIKENFKLESRRDKIIPFSHFLLRVARYALFAVGLISFSILIGATGYHYLGKISWLDSFHMACMILTGMGPVADMLSPEAKIFSSLYALYSGIAFLSITAVFFAPVIHRLLHILHVEPEEKPDNSSHQ